MTTTTISRTAKIGASTRSTTLPQGITELIVRDKDLTGFAIRIRQDSIRYIMEGRIAGTATRRKITIGDGESMPAAIARDKAMILRNQMRAGEDPVKVKETEVLVPTFADVAADYMTLWEAGKLGRKAPRPASIPSANKDLNRAMATFGKTKITEIDASALRKFRAKLLAEDISPSVKRKAFGALVLVMKHAHEAGHISTNPAAGFAPPNASPARERYLSAAELKAVWEACPALGRPGDAVMFLTAMPVRASVSMLMEWSWIDLGAKTLTIPAEATGNKAAETFVLPLTDMAVEIITRQPTREGVVFRGRQGGPVSLGSDVKDRLTKLSGVQNWRIHDLRRTTVTLLADADHEIDVDACDRWLQHKRTGIQAVYQRASRLASMRKIAASWDRTLRGILGMEKDNNVVALTFGQMAK
jgi:integrase